jgi:hypothetical protein
MEDTYKKYKCIECGFVKEQKTNHYMNTWSFGRYNCCPQCPPYKKFPEYGGKTNWKCIETKEKGNL